MVLAIPVHALDGNPSSVRRRRHHPEPGGYLLDGYGALSSVHDEVEGCGVIEVRFPASVRRFVALMRSIASWPSRRPHWIRRSGVS
jgi:hypothetical protein